MKEWLFSALFQEKKQKISCFESIKAFLRKTTNLSILEKVFNAPFNIQETHDCVCKACKMVVWTFDDDITTYTMINRENGNACSIQLDNSSKCVRMFVGGETLSRPMIKSADVLENLKQFRDVMRANSLYSNFYCEVKKCENHSLGEKVAAFRKAADDFYRAGSAKERD